MKEILISKTERLYTSEESSRDDLTKGGIYILTETVVELKGIVSPLKAILPPKKMLNKMDSSSLIRVSMKVVYTR